MRWLLVLGVLAVLVSAVVSAMSSWSPLTDHPVMQTKWAPMSSSQDRMLTVVTWVTHPPMTVGVGSINRAFRHQHLRPQYLTYEGVVAVSQTPNSLAASGADGQGWRFSVAGRLVIAGQYSLPTWRSRCWACHSTGARRFTDPTKRSSRRSRRAAAVRPAGRMSLARVPRADPERAVVTSTAARTGAPPNAVSAGTHAAPVLGTAVAVRTVEAPSWRGKRNGQVCAARSMHSSRSSLRLLEGLSRSAVVRAAGKCLRSARARWTYLASPVSVKSSAPATLPNDLPSSGTSRTA